MTPMLSEYTAVSRYSLYRGDLKRREIWEEATTRVKGMHEGFYGDKLDKIRPLFDDSFAAMSRKEALGSQRAMQFGGDAVLNKHARLYNCTGSYADRLRFFQECFWLLLCGCGTGFSVQKHHVDLLPEIRRRSLGTKIYVIPDTIEGWADSLGVLLSSFSDGNEDEVPFPEYRGHEILFDASLVREKGTSLSSGSKAPGPEPLLRALGRIAGMLEGELAAGQKKIRPIVAYDTVMHASDAVLAGGVRRSATISIFSADDEEMARAKVGADWWAKNPQRQRSNNSALLLRNETPYEDFAELVRLSKEWGEPGFAWADDKEFVPNPCFEISFYAKLEKVINQILTVKSGWQMCNLSTMSGRLCTSKEKFFELCRYASVFGTLQAGYTKFPYLGEVTEEIVRKESLIGVSITGIMENPQILLDASTLQRGAEIVLETNALVADAIEIPHAARTTCVKPEGTTSCLLDTASGIHTFHSRRGIRHVQSNQMEAPLQWFAAHNPHAVERVRGESGETTSVIAFPFEVSDHSLTKDQVSGPKLLEAVRFVQQHWVGSGKRLECCAKPWLRHNVSNTVHVAENEWDMVTRYIYDHREDFVGVSLLSEIGDKTYFQAPFVSVLLPEEQNARYGAPVVEGAKGLLGAAMDWFGDVWAATAMAKERGFVAGVPGRERYVDLVMIENANGERLFDDEERKTLFIQTFWTECERLGVGFDKLEYAMKDAWAYSRYLELREKMVPVDFAGLVEETDVIDHQAAPACSGGQCAVTL